MSLNDEGRKIAVMKTYRCNFNFAMVIHIVLFLTVICNIDDLLSLRFSIHESLFQEERIKPSCQCRKLTKSVKCLANQSFSLFLVKLLIALILITWLSCILLMSGDIHPNPGPALTSSTSSSNDSFSESMSAVLNQFHHLSFVHYNVQSIHNKLDLLTAELSEFDILAFTETWLHPNISMNELQIPTYQTPERKDRANDPHGGILIYIKDTIHYRRRQDLEPVGIECTWIEITLRNKHILFGVFYRPPNSSNIYHSMIEDSLNLALDTAINEIIVTCDFNYNVLSEQTNRKILSMSQQFSLHQCISEPTHFTETSSSLIDIILVSNKNSIILSGIGDPFLSQDTRYHCPVFGIMNFTKPKHKCFNRHIWIYEKGNYALLREKALMTDWNNLKDENVNNYATNVTDHIISISKQCIPNRMVKVKPAEPPWITSNVKRQIRKRKRLYKKARITNDPVIWRKFRKYRNETTALIRTSKQAHIDKLADKLKSEQNSPKNWWATLKSFITPENSRTIPPLQSENTILTDEMEKADLLNNYFRDQTVVDDENVEIPVIADYILNSRIENIALSPNEVTSVLKSLPLGKAAGPDGINNRILKELADCIAEPLCNLFNQSLSTGHVPDTWKRSHITPIPKQGDSSLVSNYRPISLLSTVDKVFERLVFKYLYNHLMDNNILTPFQSGFIPGDSTTNQLTYLYDTFCEALDSGKEVRVVFCDISKAFDRVWHNGLLCKLKAAGITGTALNWFKDYLKNRKQRVVLPGVMSNWVTVKAGVPQGSILGPLLFLLFINDIVSDIASNIRLFADDTTLYMIVENPLTTAEVLNSDIHKISTWAKKWLVTFNPLKTESLIISRKVNKPNHPYIYMENNQITEVNSHKHLGIFLSSDCSWHTHIEYIKVKA